jgi:tRNA threonylcarbamoyladenosine biosynthesis protein TsaE
MKFISHSLAETEMFAAHYIRGVCKMRSEAKSDTAFVLGLYGNLGSGKTAFTQAIAKILGVESPITSPTFVIEKIYPLIPALSTLDSQSSSQVSAQAFAHLIHIDAYRLESSDEMRHLGWDEIFANPQNLIVIEWPERIADLLPPDHAQLKFTFVDETTREIEVVQ